MQSKMTMLMAFMGLVISVSAQSITTRQVDIELTDTTFIDGNLKVRGEFRIEGNQADKGGRIGVISDSPRINLTESDDANSRFSILNSNGRLNFKRYDGDWNLMDDPIVMGRPGEGTTINGGLQMGTGFLALPHIETDILSATGTLLVKGSRMVADTYQGTSTDDLTDITWGDLTPVDGTLVYVQTTDSSRDIVIKHNAGNIRTNTGSDVTINVVNKVAIFMYNAGLDRWFMINPW